MNNRSNEGADDDITHIKESSKDEPNDNQGNDKLELLDKKVIGEYESIIGMDYRYFLLLSFGFGLLFMVSFYDFFLNFNGIFYPIFVVGLFACTSYAFIRLKKELSRLSYPYGIMAILLGLSSLLTMNYFVVFFNTIGIMILYGVFILKNLYPGKKFDCFRVVIFFIELVCNSIGSIHLPFKHYKQYNQKKKINMNKYKPYIKGILLGVIFLAIVLPLLVGSDMIFANVISNLLPNIILPFNGWYKYIINTLIGTVLFYGLLYSIFEKNIYHEGADKEKAEPISIATMTWFVTAVYIFYCGIQLIYLFGGSIFTLLNDISYSTYARSGFFQLVAVAAINLLLVFFCVSKVKEHTWLDRSLYVISGCTFIMIASAAYRMLLYIDAYHMTFIRILVLWFLIVLTICMAGIVYYIGNKNFYIYKFIFLTCSISYLIFGFIKPDYIIAKYNISQMDNQEVEVDLNYLLRLSLDATPAIKELNLTSDEVVDEKSMETYHLLEGYYSRIKENHNSSIRYFNFSRHKAYQVSKGYIR